MYAVIAIQISNALNIRKCRQELALPFPGAGLSKLVFTVVGWNEAKWIESRG